MAKESFIKRVIKLNPFKRSKTVSTLKEYEQAFWANWGGILSANATPENAMTVPAVWACVDALSGSIGALPKNLMKESGKGKKKRVDVASDHAMHDLVKNKPNNEQTPITVMRSWVFNAMLSGNGFIQVKSNSMGRKFLYPIEDSRSVTLDTNENGVPYYKLQTKNGTEEVPTGEMLHLVWMSRGGIMGLDAFRHLQQTLILALAAQGFAIANIRDGNHSRMVLVNKNNIGDVKQREQLSKDLKEKFAGFQKAGEVLGLSGDWSITQVKDTLLDAQYQQLDTLLDEKVARFFGIQQHIIGLLSRSTNNNIESQNMSFVQKTLLPWIVSIEQELNAKLLTDSERRQGYYFKFSLDGLLRGDTASRYTSYQTAIQNGILSPNEVRELEDRNPREDGDGDKYFTPLNMATSGSQQNGGNKNEQK